MKALDQRARTIVKVATEIVTQQEGFFRHGVSQLKPLTLRAVAETIGMHESTVSRVTSNKYLSCDRGLYELKYFFTSGIQSNDGGDAASSEAVKSRIKALIARRGGGQDPLRRPAGRDAQGRRLRHRPAHRRQISRGDRAWLVGAAAAAEGDRAGGLTTKEGPHVQGFERTAPRSGEFQVDLTGIQAVSTGCREYRSLPAS